jgi:hypothetical protein
MPTANEYISLLYKKFVGAVNGYPTRSYLGDIALYGRPYITQKQIYTNDIPTDVPDRELVGQDITTHPAYNAPNILHNKIWSGGLLPPVTTLQQLGQAYAGTGDYTHLTYYENVVLVMENPGISYTCRKDTTNLFANQVPYNTNPDLTSTYNPVITVFSRILGGSFTPTVQLPAGRSREYILDQDSGVVTFFGIPIDHANEYVTASYWRYEGLTGAGGLSAFPTTINGGVAGTVFT